MKKAVKRILIGLGIIIVVIIALAAIYFLKMQSEVKTMNPLETKQVVDNVFSIKDSFVNMYLIKDSTQYVAIDAGNSTEVVAGELKKLSINPDDVIAVLLTHTDGDHSAALKLFKNAKVYFSKQEEQLLNGGKSRFFIFGNSIDAKEYTLIDDEQTFNIGNITIKGILTEGHTFGSMCYQINGKYLFTGDALGLKDGKIVGFNDFFNVDTKTARKSMDKIVNLPDVEFLFSAHYGYSDDYKSAVKDWTNK